MIVSKGETSMPKSQSPVSHLSLGQEKIEPDFSIEHGNE